MRQAIYNKSACCNAEVYGKYAGGFSCSKCLKDIEDPGMTLHLTEKEAAQMRVDKVNNIIKLGIPVSAILK